MKHAKMNQKGFTLIELLVVVIIVAVLAAVGIPLLRGNIDRARASEAQSGLGTIRTQLRAIQAEANIPTAVNLRVIDQVNPLSANFRQGDLTGRWFEDDDYILNSIAAVPAAPGVPAVPATYCVDVTGDAAVGATGAPPQTALQGVQVAGVAFSMDQDGTLFTAIGCVAGNAING